MMYRDRYGFPEPEDFPFDLFLDLDEHEMARIIATLYDAFNEVNSLFGHFSKSGFSWDIKHLYISADKKYLVEYFRSREWRLNPWDEDELRRIAVLGEYYHKDFITLYYNTIKGTSRNAPEGRLGSSVLTVMRYVYLHEMMHQYFDRFNNKKDEMEIEEGLAEFGALYVLDELVKLGSAYDEELEWALNFVESKRGALRCYSNGARLFKRYKAGQLELKNLLEAYC